MDTHSISAPPLASSSDVIHALLSANVNDKRHFLHRGGGVKTGLGSGFFLFLFAKQTLGAEQPATARLFSARAEVEVITVIRRSRPR